MINLMIVIICESLDSTVSVQKQFEIENFDLVDSVYVFPTNCDLLKMNYF